MFRRGNKMRMSRYQLFDWATADLSPFLKTWNILPAIDSFSYILKHAACKVNCSKSNFQVKPTFNISLLLVTKHIGDIHTGHCLYASKYYPHPFKQICNWPIYIISLQSYNKITGKTSQVIFSNPGTSWKCVAASHSSLSYYYELPLMSSCQYGTCLVIHSGGLKCFHKAFGTFICFPSLTFLCTIRTSFSLN